MCKHSWKSVAVGNGLFRDECRSCGCIGYMDFEENKIKAKPKAKIISLDEYRRKRGKK